MTALCDSIVRLIFKAFLDSDQYQVVMNVPPNFAVD